MSEVRLLIRDAQREICGEAHGGFAEAVVAALSAEPETIDELSPALERFVAPGDGGYFAFFRTGADDRPHDAGVVVVDLAARLVACESTYLEPGPRGCVPYHDGQAATDIDVEYHLSENWKFVKDMSNWRDVADDRRRERQANPPLDARAVLYGRPMLEFIARECVDVFGGPHAAPAADAKDREQEEYDLARRIHVKWMMTPRPDLRGQAPRDVILARREYIDRDLQDRAGQWSEMKRPPRTLDEASAAYRFAGFGTHEMVNYYELVRNLIYSCRDEIAGMSLPANAPPEQRVADLAQHLSLARDACLDRPDPEFGGRTPRGVIHNERIRLPEAGNGADAMVDPDCPLCQLAADTSEVGFWHLDGCNMDDDFAFSWYRTIEEYQEEKRREEEFDRRFEAEQAERKRLGVSPPEGGWMDPDYAWDSTVSGDARPDSAYLRLFAVGSQLCGIIAALKHPIEERTMIDRLSRDYGNLTEVVHGRDGAATEALIDPVLAHFCESLEDVAAARTDLAAKCSDLRQRLGQFTDPPAQA